MKIVHIVVVISIVTLINISAMDQKQQSKLEPIGGNRLVRSSACLNLSALVEKRVRFQDEKKIALSQTSFALKEVFDLTLYILYGF